MPTTRSQAKRARYPSQARAGFLQSQQGQIIRLGTRGTESMLQSSRADRVSRMRELFTLFYSGDSSRSQNTERLTEQNHPLEQTRTRISDEMLAAIAEVAASDDNVFHEMQEIWLIEKSRLQVVQLLHEHDLAMAVGTTNMEVEKCVTGLQSITQTLSGELYQKLTTTRFAAGVLLLTLEEVVDRARFGTGLYERLISNPSPDEEELCVVHRLAVGEDVLEPYNGQMRRILGKFQGVPSQLQPKSDMLQKLREKIQPVSESRAGG